MAEEILVIFLFFSIAINAILKFLTQSYSFADRSTTVSYCSVSLILKIKLSFNEFEI